MLLLIDNNSLHNKELLEYLTESGVDYESCKPLDEIAPAKYNKILISGGEIKGSSTILPWYENVLLSQTVPVLGICLGMSIIHCAHGARRNFNKLSEEGVKELQLNTTFPLLNETSLKVYQDHDRSIRPNLPKQFEYGIDQKTKSIQFLQHKELPHYGVQFHPEVRVPENEGHQVLDNFLNL